MPTCLGCVCIRAGKEGVVSKPLACGKPLRKFMSHVNLKSFEHEGNKQLGWPTLSIAESLIEFVGGHNGAKKDLSLPTPQSLGFIYAIGFLEC